MVLRITVESGKHGVDLLKARLPVICLNGLNHISIKETSELRFKRFSRYGIINYHLGAVK